MQYTKKNVVIIVVVTANLVATARVNIKEAEETTFFFIFFISDSYSKFTYLNSD